MEERFAAFCAAVCSRVRAIHAWEAITAELTAHLEDHAQALTAGGLGPDAAACEAVKAMGDPAELGKSLDRAHSPWPWWTARFCITVMGIALVLFLFVGLSTANAHGGMTPLFRSMSLTQAQEQLLPPGHTLVGTCPVSGSGWVGDYYLRASGDAVLYTDPDSPGDGVSLSFLISEHHLQPWLGAMEYPWHALTAEDDLGNRYPRRGILFSPDEALLTSWQEGYIGDIHPDASSLTLTLAPGKGSVRFTVDLREEAAP